MIERVSSPRAPKPIGPYSQAIKAGGFLFVSGQLGLDPATGALPSSVEDQARQALNNVYGLLLEAGGGWRNVVKVCIYVTDLSLVGKVNDIYMALLGDAAPARTTVAVSSLPRKALVLIDAIAYLG
jgi:2-iminobutanoate/2-iminopropanoate deaminase